MAIRVKPPKGLLRKVSPGILSTPAQEFVLYSRCRRVRLVHLQSVEGTTTPAGMVAEDKESAGVSSSTVLNFNTLMKEQRLSGEKLCGVISSTISVAV